MDFFKLSFQRAIDPDTCQAIVEELKSRGFDLVNPASLDRNVRGALLGKGEQDAVTEYDAATGNVSLASGASQSFCFRRPHGNQFDKIVLRLAQEKDLASAHGIFKTVADSRGRDVTILQAMVAPQPEGEAEQNELKANSAPAFTIDM
jgi:hypothetical protein